MREWLNWDEIVEEIRDLVEAGETVDEALIDTNMKYGFTEEETDRVVDEYFTKYYD